MIAFLGELLIYSGDFDRGLALAARAKQLNPNHPGWHWYADFYNAYRQRDYRSALERTTQNAAGLRGHREERFRKMVGPRVRGTLVGRHAQSRTET